MAKQGSKAGDKGPVPTKKALIKPRPDQDKFPLGIGVSWNWSIGVRIVVPMVCGNGMGSQVVACDLVSKSYNLYAKLRKERSWKSGLTVWFSNWKMYTIWLGFHAGDRCWRCCGHYEQAGSKYQVERREEVMEKPGFSTEVATAEEKEAVSSEMVVGLDDEDGHLDYEMMEDGLDDASFEREASGDLNSMDVEEAFLIAESEYLVGEQEYQVPKKKNGKITAAAMGGNTKKRLVQSFISPRKKAMAKQGRSWNKGVGSRFNFLGLCWSIRCSYSCSYGLWKWLTKWMMVWNGYWSSPVISLLDAITGMGSQVFMLGTVAGGVADVTNKQVSGPIISLLDAITGMGSQVVACDLVSKSYNLYAKLRKERSWKSGLTVWFSNWKMYTIWLGFHAGDRCWRCCGHYEQAGSKYQVEVNRSFSVEISLSLWFSCISQVDDTNLMLIDDNLLIFWTCFYCYEYKFSSLNGFGKIIISFFLMAWGTGGVGDFGFRFLWVAIVDKASG
ncbi:hypothetical protein DY000_02022023 [Brassica cretica]|uniref:Uncharacterized protein n=1 Tax=Brassica cretica TaxID=69181 RepID=A0ABQ7E1Z8_BRACR|nr:hypothetical protein DY000_02022023 [Brassica cretica]